MAFGKENASETSPPRNCYRRRKVTVNARGTVQIGTVDKHTCVKGNVPDAKYIVYVHRVRSCWIQEISSKFNPHVMRVQVGIGTVRNFFEQKG